MYVSPFDSCKSKLSGTMKGGSRMGSELTWSLGNLFSVKNRRGGREKEWEKICSKVSDEELRGFCELDITASSWNYWGQE